LAAPRAKQYPGPGRVGLGRRGLIQELTQVEKDGARDPATVELAYDQLDFGRGVDGKGHNVLLRRYGPLEPWFDQTWRLGDFELQP
jgi:hypothetical protein